jgi:SAM-dependent methyltransferase
VLIIYWYILRLILVISRSFYFLRELRIMNQWNVELYEAKHAYVWQYGENLLEMLAPSPQEYILDLGCGTGQLTAQIAATGAVVVGLDAAASAIAQCRQNYPQLEFVVANSLDRTTKATLIDEIVRQLHPALYRDEHWWADYCRIRILARKPS